MEDKNMDMENKNLTEDAAKAAKAAAPADKPEEKINGIQNLIDKAKAQGSLTNTEILSPVTDARSIKKIPGV